MKAAINNLSKQNPLLLATGAVLILGAVYFIVRKTLGDAFKGAGGLFSGNNAATKGTVYEGAGVAGTAGAVTNAVLGGVPEAIGNWIGGLLSSDSAGERVYYTVTFPDGARHSVPSTSIASNGAFTYQGTRYVIGTQSGVRVARLAA